MSDSTAAPTWEHIISKDGLKLTSSVTLPDGRIHSTSVSWSDKETAKANYANARRAAEKTYDKIVEQAEEAPINDQDSSTVLKEIANIFGRKIHLGRSKGQEYDEAALTFGKRKVKVNLDEGKWDGKSVNFENDTETNDGKFIAGVGGHRNAFFISISKK